MKDKPISIENRWDILYRDYPEVFDDFDVEQTSFYGSLKKTLSIYGFIFGKKAIKHIEQENIT
jgi:hypothetical protein